MTEQITRYYDPVDKTLEKLYKENVLEKKDELPYVDSPDAMFLMPNGDYFQTKTGHMEVIQNYLPPNQNYQDFLNKNKVILIHNLRKEMNRLDFVILSPITQAQLKTIYRTYKDDPTLWITYDVVE